jgi:hypothetical protein
MQSDKKQFLNGIASKLAVLLGGAVAATGLNASPVAAVMPETQTNAVTSVRTPRTLTPKLILKQQSEGFKMIASHDSHSSHSSHSSHASHSSHSSGGF